MPKALPKTDSSYIRSRRLLIEGLESRALLSSFTGIGLAPNLDRIDSACLWLPLERLASANDRSESKGSGETSQLESAASIQEFWVPAAKANTLANSWPVTEQAMADFAFGIPSNFTSLVSVKLVVVPRVETTATYDLQTTIARNGQATDVVTNKLLGQGPITLVPSVLKEIDVTGVFNITLAAGADNVSLHFNMSDPMAVQVVGLRFMYVGQAGPQGPVGPQGPPGDTRLSLGDSIKLYDGANITASLQAAINDTKNSVIRLITPGTYFLSPNTVNPYWNEQASHTCILINRNNLTIEIGQGVTLKMADGSQNNVNGLCYMFIFRDRDNIKFTGGGTLDMNSINQPQFTNFGNPAGPYGQEVGGIIRGFFDHSRSDSPGCTNITVENLRLLNTFGNPANVYANRKVTSESNIYFRNLYCERLGEGLQIVGAKNCAIEQCTIYDISDVARGDALEFSDCRNFRCVNNVVRGNTNGGDQGSACDIFLSRDGVIDGNIFDGWSDGLGCGWQNSGERNANIIVTNNLFKNLRSGFAAPDSGEIYFANNVWENITEGPPVQYRGSTSYTCVITAIGKTATVTAAGHGYQTGSYITVSGASEAQYNGTFKITRISDSQFSYTMTEAPTGPATGSPQFKGYRTAIRHVGDVFRNSASIYIDQDSDVSFENCEILYSTGNGITIYGSSVSSIPTVQIRGCKFVRNHGNAIVVSASGFEFAPKVSVYENIFEDNGGTIAEDVDGSIQLFRIKDNVGYPDSAPYSPASIDHVRSWYRQGHSLFQNANKTAPALAEGQPVRVWADSLGIGPDFIATDDQSRPTVDSNGGIVGNGSSQYLRTPETFLANGPYTVILRFRARSVYPYNDNIFSVQKSVTDTNEIVVGAFQGNSAFVYEEDDSSADSLSTARGIDITVGYAVDSNGNRFIYKGDGVRAESPNPTGEDSTAYAFLLANSDGANPPLATAFGVGPVRHCVVVDRVMTQNEFTKLNEYFENEPRGFNGDYFSLTNIPDTSNPIGNDSDSLGDPSTAWSDLYLANGAVINFDHGDATIRHSSQTIAFSGASNGYTFDSPLSTPGLFLALVTKSTDYTLTSDDSTVKADASSRSIAITLPTAVGKIGRVYIVKKVDSSANEVLIATTSSQKIDGATTTSLTRPWQSIMLQSDGSNWIIL